MLDTLACLVAVLVPVEHGDGTPVHPEPVVTAEAVEPPRAEYEPFH